MKLSGLGGKSRLRLGKILRRTKGSISVEEASAILNLSRAQVAKLLATWNKQGWIRRIKRGLYMPITDPLTAKSHQNISEDSWVEATKLFPGCYIGYLTAASHWDFTDQIFSIVHVVTSKKINNRSPKHGGTTYKITTTTDNNMTFGLQVEWRSQTKVNISDPSKTILDMLGNPVAGGGVRNIVDMLKRYMNSDFNDMSTLMKYADLLNKGAVYKRLGFLLETYFPNETGAITECRENMTTGNAKIDPSLNKNSLVTSWRLWIPTYLKESLND